MNYIEKNWDQITYFTYGALVTVFTLSLLQMNLANAAVMAVLGVWVHKAQQLMEIKR